MYFYLRRLAPSKKLSLDEDSLKIQVKKKEERLASFRLIISTAVEGCHYADGRRTYIVSARVSGADSL